MASEERYAAGIEKELENLASALETLRHSYATGLQGTGLPGKARRFVKRVLALLTRRQETMNLDFLNVASGLISLLQHALALNRHLEDVLREQRKDFASRGEELGEHLGDIWKKIASLDHQIASLNTLVEFARLETSIALEYRDAVRAGDREWIKRVFQRYVELHPKCSVAFDEEDQARRRDAVSSLTRSGKILEVGCADGGIISDLDPEGRFLVGLDIAMDYLTEGRPPAHYVNGMAEALPFVDDAFDTVLLPEIVEHVPDPREVIAEAVRVATRDVVLTFPVNVPDPTHLWNFSEESFDDLVGAFTELHIDEKKSVGRFRVWRAVLRRQT